jgi:hypothetical protein
MIEDLQAHKNEKCVPDSRLRDVSMEFISRRHHLAADLGHLGANDRHF